MVSPTAVQKNGEDWARQNPVGTGPFKFVTYQKDVKLVATKFADYWQKGKPYLDGLEIDILADTNTREMAFEAGDLDVAFIMEGKQAEDMKAAGYQYLELPSSIRPVHALVPSSSLPTSPLSDVRVRQAIGYAIDRQTLCNALGYGLKIPLHQIAPIGSAAFILGLETQGQYNPTKAKQLLAAAGYPNGFKTRIITNPSWLDRNMTVALQAQLAKVGIQAALEFPEIGKYTQYRFTPAGWGDGLMYQEFANWPLYPVHLSFYWNHNPAQFFTTKYPDGMDALVKAILTNDVVDPKQVQQFDQMMFDNETVIPLYELDKVAFVKKGVHDTHILNYGFKDDWTPADAWIEKSAQ